MEDEAFLAGFVAAVAGLLAEHSVIIVHGGGKEITDLHAQLGVATETVEGLRATSEESLRLVEMVLNGVVNTRLVRWLVNGGVDALGLSGVDMGLVRVSPLAINGRSLGRVGKVGAVNGEALLQLLDLGLTPVISPVSLGEDGLTYNVNADHVAAGVAVGGRGEQADLRQQRAGGAGDRPHDAGAHRGPDRRADRRRPHHRRHDPQGALGHRGGRQRRVPGGDHRSGRAGAG